MQLKRLFILFLLTACSLVAALGIAQLAQARDASAILAAPEAPTAAHVLTLTLSASRPDAFDDPGPPANDRAAYWNPAVSQVLSASASISSSHGISIFQAGAAFGVGSRQALTAPWLISYPVAAGQGLQPDVPFVVTTTGGLRLTRLITFTPDLTAPTGLLDAPAFHNISFSLGFTLADLGSGPAAGRVWFQSPATVTWQTASALLSSVTGSLPFSPAAGEGSYWFGLVVTDRVGNDWSGLTLTDAARTVFDTTPPSTTLSGPLVVSSSQVALQWWTTDSLSGPAGTQLWFRTPATTTWTETGLPQPGLSGTVVFSAPAAGRFLLAASATDRAGNQGALSGVVETLVDPDPPVITAVEVSTTHPGRLYQAERTVFFSGTQLITITVVWTDANPASLAAGPAFGITPSLVLAAPWSVSYTIPPSVPLQTIIPLTVTDGGGLQSATSLTVTQDGAPPTAVLTAPVYSDAPIPIDFAAYDEGGSGPAKLSLWLLAPATTTWQATGLVTEAVTGTWSYTPAGEGWYTWGTVITDQVGNRSQLLTGTNATLYDQTPPTGTVQVAGVITNRIPISITFWSSDSLSGIAQTELWARPPGVITWTATGLTETGTSGLSRYSPAGGDGLYQLASRVTDRAGNVKPVPDAAEAAITLDRGAPTATVTSPLYAPGPSISVTWQATDTTSGVSLVTLWVSQPPTHNWQATDLTGTSVSGVWPFALPVDGAYHFAAVAIDEADNAEPAPTGSGESTTWRDTQSPVVTSTGIVEFNSPYLYALGDLLYYSNQMPTPAIFQVTGVATDASAGLDQAVFPTAFGGTPNPDTTPANWSGTYFVSQQQNWGDGQIVVQVYDRIGLSASAVFTYRRDVVAPTSTLTSVPSATVSSPVTLPWQAADAGSGVAATALWLRPAGGAWVPTGASQGGISGTFVYSLPAEGWYDLATVASDNVGNQEAEPGGGDGRLLYDATPPDSAASSPWATNQSPISVTWSVTDSLSGIALTELWVRVGPTGTWAAAGLTSTALGGTFLFTPTVETVYAFATVAWDALGNREPPPTGDGDTTTLYDVSPPDSAAGSPWATNDSPITVTWTVTDPLSGVAFTEFWVRVGPTGTWAAAGLTSTALGGTFLFTPTVETVYAFATVAWDSLGNREPTPTGDGDTVTLYDVSPPDSAAGSPWATNDSPISVTWTVTDSLSGVALTELWARVGPTGTWAAAGLTSTALGGTFLFSPSVETVYAFATVAWDSLGNHEPPPTGDGDTVTLYDITPADSAASSPWATNHSPITVTWTVTDSLSGVALTEFWVRVGPTGTWAAAGLTNTALGGTFLFTPSVETVYAFATRAEDQLGNSEPQPSGDGDTTTIFDLTGPAASILVPTNSTTSSVVVSWNAQDPPPGVGLDPAGAFSLDYRVAAGAWTPWLTATNQLSATFGPTWPITVSYDTTYAFRLRSWDALGNPGAPVSATTRIAKAFTFLPLIVSRFDPLTDEGFESGWGRWSHGGGLGSNLAIDVVHGGAQSVLLGSPDYACMNGVPIDSGWIETEVTVPYPPAGQAPTLQIWFNMWTQDKFSPAEPYRFDGLQININNVVTPTAAIGIAEGPASCDFVHHPPVNSGWQLWQVALPHGNWGQQITLRIALHNRPDRYYNTWTYIDDIALVNAPLAKRQSLIATTRVE